MSSFKTPKGTILPIMDLRGKDYLEVKYRVVWFREEKPTWAIETEYLQVTADVAIAKATIRDDQGRVIATGHKTETPQGFADFVEKAETGAIGRALALCGFGTQFCADELDEGDRIVDAPATRPGRIVAGVPGIEDGIQMPLDQLGEYKVPIGKKFIGRPLKDIDLNELRSFVTWLDDAAKRDRKDHPPKTLEFVNHATRYIIECERQMALSMGAPA